MCNEYREYKNNYIEYENKIKRCLFTVAEALINLVRESKNFEKDVLIHISNSVDDANVELQKISEYLNNNFGKLNADNQAILEILQMILEQNQEDSAKIKSKRQPVKSRTQEYADKWETNMFLNDFDKRDQNAGTNVRLKEVYLAEHLPHYIWYRNDENEPLTDLKELLSEYINEKRDSKMLLILGQPGIGKSTLITWITANFSESIDDILVYRFASDLRNVDWKDGRISNRVLEEFGLSHSDLNGKTLIIDGFDEVSIEPNWRRDILDSLYGDWINNKTIENFSLIITCRENYVSKFAILKCKYITLQPWDEIQIKSFCNIFQDKIKNNISKITREKLLENKEILGIPLILYMVLALNISIEKEGSIVDVYDKIFSLEGGIYDRCIDNKMFEDKHRIAEIKMQVHQISREIAIWMFENNSDQAYIPQEEYQKICNNVIQEQQKNQEIEQDFLIGNFFKLVKHCEGGETEELYFVHRSIYEYFVAETIFNYIENATIELTEESQKELAGNIAIYLKQGQIIPIISEYIQFKILKFYDKLDANKKRKFYQYWENTIQRMLCHGMFYYTEKNIHDYKNIIAQEIICFMNLLDILRCLLFISDRQFMLMNIPRTYVERYIKYYSIEYEKEYVFSLVINNLSRIFIRGVDLRRMYLANINLERSYLGGALLECADLRGANLKSSNLKKTNLHSTNLEHADLRGADLRGAYLKTTNLEGADLREADLRKAIFEGSKLEGTYLDDSIWLKYDIKKASGCLKVAIFSSIIVEDNNIRTKMCREEVFCL